MIDPGVDLKTRILSLLELHPAAARPDVVYNVFVDFAVTLAVARHGDRARDFWVRSFDVAQAVQRVEAAMGAGK